VNAQLVYLAVYRLIQFFIKLLLAAAAADDDDDDDDAGVMVRRQKLPKDDVGNHYSWKDLNIGVNVCAYGKVFHFYDCDKFTRVCQLIRIYTIVSCLIA